MMSNTRLAIQAPIGMVMRIGWNGWPYGPASGVRGYFARASGVVVSSTIPPSVPARREALDGCEGAQAPARLRQYAGHTGLSMALTRNRSWWNGTARRGAGRGRTLGD